MAEPRGARIRIPTTNGSPTVTVSGRMLMTICGGAGGWPPPA
jgi:hypothetical protein